MKKSTTQRKDPRSLILADDTYVWDANDPGTCEICGRGPNAPFDCVDGTCMDCAMLDLMRIGYDCAVCGRRGTHTWPRAACWSSVGLSLWAPSDYETDLVPCCGSCMTRILALELAEGRKAVVDVEVPAVLYDGEPPIRERRGIPTVRCLLESVSRRRSFTARPAETSSRAPSLIKASQIVAVVGPESRIYPVVEDPRTAMLEVEPVWCNTSEGPCARCGGSKATGVARGLGIEDVCLECSLVVFRRARTVGMCAGCGRDTIRLWTRSAGSLWPGTNNELVHCCDFCAGAILGLEPGARVVVDAKAIDHEDCVDLHTVRCLVIGPAREYGSVQVRPLLAGDSSPQTIYAASVWQVLCGPSQPPAIDGFE